MVGKYYKKSWKEMILYIVSFYYILNVCDKTEKHCMRSTASETLHQKNCITSTVSEALPPATFDCTVICCQKGIIMEPEEKALPGIGSLSTFSWQQIYTQKSC
jgi:hypothetical protein